MRAVLSSLLDKIVFPSGENEMARMIVGMADKLADLLSCLHIPQAEVAAVARACEDHCVIRRDSYRVESIACVEYLYLLPGLDIP